MVGTGSTTDEEVDDVVLTVEDDFDVRGLYHSGFGGVLVGGLTLGGCLVGVDEVVLVVVASAFFTVGAGP